MFPIFWDQHWFFIRFLYIYPIFLVYEFDFFPFIFLFVTNYKVIY